MGFVPTRFRAITSRTDPTRTHEIPMGRLVGASCCFSVTSQAPRQRYQIVLPGLYSGNIPTYNRTYIFSHFVEGNIMPVYRTIPVYGVDIFAQSHFNVKDTNQLSPPFLSGRIRARPVAQPLVGVGPSKTRNTSPPPMFSTRSSVCKNALSRV